MKRHAFDAFEILAGVIAKILNRKKSKEMAFIDTAKILLTGLLVVIAIGSIIMISNSWFAKETNRRLTNLEKGQTALETGQVKLKAELKAIKENQTEIKDLIKLFSKQAKTY